MGRTPDRKLRRSNTLGRSALAVGVLGLLATAIVWLPAWLEPSLQRDRIRTARVEVGPVEATAAASGIVVPAFQQVAVSPVESRILRVPHKPGTSLEKGDLIMLLDPGEANLDAARVAGELELNRATQRQTRIDLETRLGELATTQQIQRLEVEKLQARALQSRDLVERGAVSRQYVRQAEQAEEEAVIHLRQIEGSRRTVAAAAKSRIEALALRQRALERELAEAQRREDRAEIRADRPGVLTWVLEEVGAAVYPGEIIARVADLSSFRVDASLAAVHGSRIGQGLQVHVALDDGEFLGGEVSAAPVIEGGMMTLEVALENPSDPRLRSDMRVDVFVVTERKHAAIRIPAGPFIDGAGDRREIFVLLGDVAVRRRVQIGLASFDYCEVLVGLAAGEEVIISDTADFLHLSDVTVR